MLRTILALAFFAGICVTAISIANADDKPAQDRPAQEMSAADTAKWLTFFDRLVTAVVKSSGTCEKLASDVNKVIDANQAAIELAKAAHQAGRKLPASAQAHMMEGVKKMVPGLQKCGQDDKVRAAFAKLDLTRKPAAAARR
ncbi:MAG TPA: hypothetical protein VIV11_13230 [Kofleriaceae bacterium]